MLYTDTTTQSSIFAGMNHARRAISFLIMILVCSLLIFIFTTSAFAQEPNFDQAHVFSVDRAFSSLVLGDIDGDGDLDIVSSGGYGNDQPNIIYLNDGTGNFVWQGSTRRFGNEQGQTRSIAVGDIDGDGDLDIVAGNYQRQNAIYLNDGSGHFDWKGSTRSFGDENGYTSVVALGDLDRNGSLDIVVGSKVGDVYQSDAPTQTLVVYLNDNQGGFGWKGGIHFFGQKVNYVRDIKIVDINHDGSLDLITGHSVHNGSESNKIFLNDGNGNFDLPNATYTYGYGDGIVSIALGDLDANGFVDISTSSGWGKSFDFYLNDGLNDDQRDIHHWNQLRTSIEIDDPKLLGVQAVAIGDMDSDGSPDIVIGTNEKNAIYLNDGNGHFQADHNIPYGEGKTRTTIVALGDLNGDGYLDIVNHTNRRGIIYFNNGAGKFSNENTKIRNVTTFDPNAAEINDIAIGDLNDDGYLDIVTSNWKAQNMIYLNDGTGTCGSDNKSAPFGTGHDKTFSVALGDLDGNKHLDIVTANIGEQNVAYLNDGNGNFNQAGGAHNFGTGHDATFSVALGDMNGDNFLDIVAGNFTQKSIVYLNDGNGNFDWEGNTRVFGAAADRTISVAVGDVDHDGDLDIVAGNSGQPSVVYLNDSKGNFSWDGSTYPISVNPYGTFHVALGDLNGDGYLDIVSGNNTQKVFYVEENGNIDPANGVSNDQSLIFLNDGTGHFSEDDVNSFGSLGHETFDIALGDIDSDGDIDIVTGDSKTIYEVPEQKNTIYLNDGKGNFSLSRSRILQRNYNQLGYNSRIAVGDMDRDGDLDIIANGSSDPNTVYLNHLKPGKEFNLNGESVAYEVNQASFVTIDPSFVTGNANYYAGPFIWTEPIIPITYTLWDRESDRVGSIAVFYSLDGGDHWQPALAESGTITSGLETNLNGITHVFNWSISDSSIFGRSDNVVVRIRAYAQPSTSAPNGTYRYTDTVSGPYLWPYTSATTSPFRIRGTQVQVVDETGNGVENALVYIIRAKENSSIVIGNSTSIFHTDNQGYLQGRGALGSGDQLLALAPQPLPVTTTMAWAKGLTDTIHLYYTNGEPTEIGVDAIIRTTNGVTSTAVISPGIQVLQVSKDHPLILFDLSVSLEWDASTDPNEVYLSQLKSDVHKASEYLYDFTNGQIALGNVLVLQNAEGWESADVVVQTTNRLRPLASQGGIVLTTTVDSITNGTEITYDSGQVRMGSTWNRYGEPGNYLGSDWSLTLAHELSHYLLFQDDTYLGLTDNNLLVPITSCVGSAMGDMYVPSGVNTEFVASEEWLQNCACTLANKSLRRSEWETILKFYPMLQASHLIADNPGPIRMPFDFTTIDTPSPITPTQTLPDRIEYLDYEDGVVSSAVGRSYLIRDEQYIFDLGSPVGGQNRLLLRGAQTGDRLCVIDEGRSQFGCEPVSPTDERLAMKQSKQHPIIQVQPLTTTILQIKVGGLLTTSLLYSATIYPEFGEAIIPTGLISDSQGTYTWTYALPYPILSGHVRLWSTDHGNDFEYITSFSIGGNPGKGPALQWGHPLLRGKGPALQWGHPFGRGRWPALQWGHPDLRGGWASTHAGNAPAISSDGQMIFFVDDPNKIPEGALYAVNSISITTHIDSATSKVIGFGYQLSAYTQTETILAGSISIQYLGIDTLSQGITEESEHNLSIYFSEDGEVWSRIPNQVINPYFNLASAESQGAGIYALLWREEPPVIKPSSSTCTIPTNH